MKNAQRIKLKYIAMAVFAVVMFGFAGVASLLSNCTVRPADSDLNVSSQTGVNANDWTGVLGSPGVDKKFDLTAAPDSSMYAGSTRTYYMRAGEVMTDCFQVNEGQFYWDPLPSADIMAFMGSYASTGVQTQVFKFYARICGRTKGTLYYANNGGNFSPFYKIDFVFIVRNDPFAHVENKSPQGSAITNRISVTPSVTNYNFSVGTIAINPLGKGTMKIYGASISYPSAPDAAVYGLADLGLNMLVDNAALKNGVADLGYACTQGYFRPFGIEFLIRNYDENYVGLVTVLVNESATYNPTQSVVSRVEQRTKYNTSEFVNYNSNRYDGAYNQNPHGISGVGAGNTSIHPNSLTSYQTNADSKVAGYFAQGKDNYFHEVTAQTATPQMTAAISGTTYEKFGEFAEYKSKNRGVGFDVVAQNNKQFKTIETVGPSILIASCFIHPTSTGPYDTVCNATWKTNARKCSAGHYMQATPAVSGFNLVAGHHIHGGYQFCTYQNVAGTTLCMMCGDTDTSYPTYPNLSYNTGATAVSVHPNSYLPSLYTLPCIFTVPVPPALGGGFMPGATSYSVEDINYNTTPFYFSQLTAGSNADAYPKTLATDSVTLSGTEVKKLALSALDGQTTVIGQGEAGVYIENIYAYDRSYMSVGLIPAGEKSYIKITSMHNTKSPADPRYDPKYLILTLAKKSESGVVYRRLVSVKVDVSGNTNGSNSNAIIKTNLDPVSTFDDYNGDITKQNQIFKFEGYRGINKQFVAGRITVSENVKELMPNSIATDPDVLDNISFPIPTDNDLNKYTDVLVIDSVPWRKVTTANFVFDDPNGTSTINSSEYLSVFWLDPYNIRIQLDKVRPEAAYYLKVMDENFGEGYIKIMIRADNEPPQWSNEEGNIQKLPNHTYVFPNETSGSKNTRTFTGGELVFDPSTPQSLLTSSPYTPQVAPKPGTSEATMRVLTTIPRDEYVKHTLDPLGFNANTATSHIFGIATDPDRIDIAKAPKDSNGKPTVPLVDKLTIKVVNESEIAPYLKVVYEDNIKVDVGNENFYANDAKYSLYPKTREGFKTIRLYALKHTENLSGKVLELKLALTDGYHNPLAPANDADPSQNGILTVKVVILNTTVIEYYHPSNYANQPNENLWFKAAAGESKNFYGSDLGYDFDGDGIDILDVTCGTAPYDPNNRNVQITLGNDGYIGEKGSKTGYISWNLQKAADGTTYLTLTAIAKTNRTLNYARINNGSAFGHFAIAVHLRDKAEVRDEGNMRDDAVAIIEVIVTNTAPTGVNGLVIGKSGTKTEFTYLSMFKDPDVTKVYPAGVGSNLGVWADKLSIVSITLAEGTPADLIDEVLLRDEKTGYDENDMQKCKIIFYHKKRTPPDKEFYLNVTMKDSDGATATIKINISIANANPIYRYREGEYSGGIGTLSNPRRIDLYADGSTGVSSKSQMRISPYQLVNDRDLHKDLRGNDNYELQQYVDGYPKIVEYDELTGYPADDLSYGAPKYVYSDLDSLVFAQSSDFVITNNIGAVTITRASDTCIVIRANFRNTDNPDILFAVDVYDEARAVAVRVYYLINVVNAKSVISNTAPGYSAALENKPITMLRVSPLEQKIPDSSSDALNAYDPSAAPKLVPNPLYYYPIDNAGGYRADDAYMIPGANAPNSIEYSIRDLVSDYDGDTPVFKVNTKVYFSKSSATYRNIYFPTKSSYNASVVYSGRKYEPDTNEAEGYLSVKVQVGTSANYAGQMVLHIEALKSTMDLTNAIVWVAFSVNDMAQYSPVDSDPIYLPVQVLNSEPTTLSEALNYSGNNKLTGGSTFSVMIRANDNIVSQGGVPPMHNSISYTQDSTSSPLFIVANDPDGDAIYLNSQTQYYAKNLSSSNIATSYNDTYGNTPDWYFVLSFEEIGTYYFTILISDNKTFLPNMDAKATTNRSVHSLTVTIVLTEVKVTIKSDYQYDSDGKIIYDTITGKPKYVDEAYTHPSIGIMSGDKENPTVSNVAEPFDLYKFVEPDANSDMPTPGNIHAGVKSEYNKAGVMEDGSPNADYTEGMAHLTGSASSVRFIRNITAKTAAPKPGYSFDSVDSPYNRISGGYVESKYTSIMLKEEDAKFIEILGGREELSGGVGSDPYNNQWAGQQRGFYIRALQRCNKPIELTLRLAVYNGGEEMVRFNTKIYVYVKNSAIVNQESSSNSNTFTAISTSTSRVLVDTRQVNANLTNEAVPRIQLLLSDLDPMDEKRISFASLFADFDSALFTAAGKAPPSIPSVDGMSAKYNKYNNLAYKPSGSLTYNFTDYFELRNADDVEITAANTINALKPLPDRAEFYVIPKKTTSQLPGGTFELFFMVYDDYKGSSSMIGDNESTVITQSDILNGINCSNTVSRTIVRLQVKINNTKAKPIRSEINRSVYFGDTIKYKYTDLFTDIDIPKDVYSGSTYFAPTSFDSKAGDTVGDLQFGYNNNGTFQMSTGNTSSTLYNSSLLSADKGIFRPVDFGGSINYADEKCQTITFKILSGPNDKQSQSAEIYVSFTDIYQGAASDYVYVIIRFTILNIAPHQIGTTFEDYNVTKAPLASNTIPELEMDLGQQIIFTLDSTLPTNKNYYNPTHSDATDPVKGYIVPAFDADTPMTSALLTISSLTDVNTFVNVNRANFLITQMGTAKKSFNLTATGPSGYYTREDFENGLIPYDTQIGTPKPVTFRFNISDGFNFILVSYNIIITSKAPTLKLENVAESTLLESEKIVAIKPGASKSIKISDLVFDIDDALLLKSGASAEAKIIVSNPIGNPYDDDVTIFNNRNCVVSTAFVGNSPFVITSNSTSAANISNLNASANRYFSLESINTSGLYTLKITALAPYESSVTDGIYLVGFYVVDSGNNGVYVSLKVLIENDDIVLANSSEQLLTLKPAGSDDPSQAIALSNYFKSAADNTKIDTEYSNPNTSYSVRIYEVNKEAQTRLAIAQYIAGGAFILENKSSASYTQYFDFVSSTGIVRGKTLNLISKKRTPVNVSSFIEIELTKTLWKVNPEDPTAILLENGSPKTRTLTIKLRIQVENSNPKLINSNYNGFEDIAKELASIQLYVGETIEFYLYGNQTGIDYLMLDPDGDMMKFDIGDIDVENDPASEFNRCLEIVYGKRTTYDSEGAEIIENVPGLVTIKAIDLPTAEAAHLAYATRVMSISVKDYVQSGDAEQMIGGSGKIRIPVTIRNSAPISKVTKVQFKVKKNAPMDPIDNIKISSTTVAGVNIDSISLEDLIYDANYSSRQESFKLVGKYNGKDTEFAKMMTVSGLTVYHKTDQFKPIANIRLSGDAKTFEIKGLSNERDISSFDLNFTVYDSAEQASSSITFQFIVANSAPIAKPNPTINILGSNEVSTSKIVFLNEIDHNTYYDLLTQKPKYYTLATDVNMSEEYNVNTDDKFRLKNINEDVIVQEKTSPKVKVSKFSNSSSSIKFSDRGGDSINDETRAFIISTVPEQYGVAKITVRLYDTNLSDKNKKAESCVITLTVNVARNPNDFSDLGINIIQKHKQEILPKHLYYDEQEIDETKVKVDASLGYEFEAGSLNYYDPDKVYEEPDNGALESKNFNNNPRLLMSTINVNVKENAMDQENYVGIITSVYDAAKKAVVACNMIEALRRGSATLSVKLWIGDQIFASIFKVTVTANSEPTQTMFKFDGTEIDDLETDDKYGEYKYRSYSIYNMFDDDDDLQFVKATSDKPLIADARLVLTTRAGKEIGAGENIPDDAVYMRLDLLCKAAGTCVITVTIQDAINTYDFNITYENTTLEPLGFFAMAYTEFMANRTVYLLIAGGILVVLLALMLFISGVKKKRRMRKNIDALLRNETDMEEQLLQLSAQAANNMSYAMLPTGMDPGMMLGMQSAPMFDPGMMLDSSQNQPLMNQNMLGSSQSPQNDFLQLGAGSNYNNNNNNGFNGY